MEKLEACPICGCNKTKHFIDCIDHTVSRETYSIVRCEQCGFLFTNPRPDKEKIGQYYKSEEYISHSNSSKGIINKLYQEVRKYTLGSKFRLVSSLTKGTRILDIGCGTGEFLNTCKKAGWTCIGIEPDQGARQYGLNNYGLDVKEECAISTLESASFDIITMWHVLEHVYDLKERVAELDRLVKPEGTILIAVPNSSSSDALHYKEAWAAYDVPRHLYHFQPKDIELLFKGFGLNVVRILPMKFDSFYVSMLSEKYQSGKTNLLKALWRGFSSNMSARSNGQTYSSQIYVIKKN